MSVTRERHPGVTVTLTVTGHDSMIVWGMLSGYLGGAGLHLGVAKVSGPP